MIHATQHNGRFRNLPLWHVDQFSIGIAWFDERITPGMGKIKKSVFAALGLVATLTGWRHCG
ncbi:hypothetical protein ACFXJ8_20160 [Nonomuraea sp. NPDC059194]|uniref:hypothetical protein n=1 Tax=Nonomuraea sp. NPDC059194 TaxID=3346764 RepID=UPI00369B9460